MLDYAHHHDQKLNHYWSYANKC